MTKPIMYYICILGAVTVAAMLCGSASAQQPAPKMVNQATATTAANAGSSRTPTVAPKTAPAETKPTDPPQLTGDEKAAIFQAQRNQAALAIQMQNMELNYSKLQQQQQSATKTFQDALEAAQKRIGENWRIDPDSLAVTAAPPPPAPTPAPKPQK